MSNKEPLRLYVVYDELKSGGDVCKGEENDDWPTYEDAHIDVRFKALYRNPPADRFFYDSFEVSEDIHKESNLHMAVIRYYDGGSFGRVCGRWYVAGFYKSSKEAADGIQAVLDADYKHTYKPWEGYFSGYECSQIEVLPVFEC